MNELIRREDALRLLADYLMVDANMEYPDASEDIADWKELAEEILEDIQTVDAIELGEEYRTDAFDITFITYKSEDGSEVLEAFRIERAEE